jgi:hypothetical protein
VATGFIERKEFRKLIKRLAPQMSKEETDEVFNTIDTVNGNKLKSLPKMPQQLLELHAASNDLGKLPKHLCEQPWPYMRCSV